MGRLLLGLYFSSTLHRSIRLELRLCLAIEPRASSLTDGFLRAVLRPPNAGSITPFQLEVLCCCSTHTHARAPVRCPAAGFIQTMTYCGGKKREPPPHNLGSAERGREGALLETRRRRRALVKVCSTSGSRKRAAAGAVVARLASRGPSQGRPRSLLILVAPRALPFTKAWPPRVLGMAAARRDRYHSWHQLWNAHACALACA